jgi:styrene-oxide isomerase
MTKRYESLMIGNGALIFFVGLMSGYLFLFRLIEEISIWPIPGSIKIVLPADERAWRAAHVGNILNALMLIGIGLSLSRLRVSVTSAKVICWGLILSAWGNFGFYTLSAFGATGRGLSFGENRFGGGDLLSTLTFLVAYPGAILAPIAMLLVARGAFAGARETAPDELGVRDAHGVTP